MAQSDKAVPWQEWSTADGGKNWTSTGQHDPWTLISAQSGYSVDPAGKLVRFTIDGGTTWSALNFRR